MHEAEKEKYKPLLANLDPLFYSNIMKTGNKCVLLLIPMHICINEFYLTNWHWVLGFHRRVLNEMCSTYFREL